MAIEIYFSDLTKEKQQEIIDIIGEESTDVYAIPPSKSTRPIAILPTEEWELDYLDCDC